MWDVALDGETGDIIFGPGRDLLGSSGPELNLQRILTRCKIVRGSFVYDPDDTLGSRLNEISRYTTDRQVREAPPLVMEALEPMDDISVSSVEAEITEDNRLLIIVQYQPVVSDDEAEIPVEEIPEYEARVTY